VRAAPPGRLVGLVAIGLALAGGPGCDRHQGNFSQHPGFAVHFAAHPRAGHAATPGEQALLERHRPRLFLPAGHPGPIDFYADYVAHGRLIDGAGRLVSTRVTPAILNALRHDPGAVFVHQPGTAPPTRVVYGRVDRETITFPAAGGPVAEPFTFLTYNVVFRVSGLPAGLAWWRAGLLGLVASLDDWHQLDHYTAVMLALDGDLFPVALTLQQHNHLHTYVLGADLPRPADGRVRVDVAIRSNELYPHVPGRTRRRAVGRPDPASLRYLISGRDPPFLAADDLTDPAAEVDYALAFLPRDDAFYVFQGYLGERRWLRNREGPPGADYNTLPALKPRGVQLLAFYWRDGDEGDLARLEASLGSPHPLLAFARAQAPVFYRRLLDARAARSAGG
jgi:hypothetical protein